MTIGNYLEYLGIDSTAILSEETKTELYVCKAFRLKKKSRQEVTTASIRTHEYKPRSTTPASWLLSLSDTP